MARLPTIVTRAVVGVVVVAIVVATGYFAFFAGATDKKVTARFASAVGIYDGTPVRILGVNVGSVTGVHPKGDFVEVEMTYDTKYALPANVTAVEVANSLVSDRYIQLTPAWNTPQAAHTALRSGATIPLARTGGPAELDDIYAALDKLAVALGPQGANKGGKDSGALSTLLTVAAANLKGNGAALGNSISDLAAAAQTLATKRDDLFGTVKNLQRFTATLHASDTQIRDFNGQLAAVASDLASERTDLGAALHDLTVTLDKVNSFVKQNAGRFHTDIRGLKDITDLLVKQKASINETLAVAPVALANIVHAYDPDLGVIATRSNLASLTSLTNTSPTKILCSVLDKVLGGLAGALSNACKGLTGLTGGAANTPSTPGVTIPGLIGGGR